MREFRWEEIEDMPHLLLPDIILRVGHQHVPYSYGAVSYRILQLLTPNGWQPLLVIEYKASESTGQDLASIAAGQQCKAYAERIYANKIIEAMQGSGV